MEPIQEPLITLESLKQDIRQMGLTEGMTILVHSSLSQLGWVCGGAEVICRALMDVITNKGTIMMPTQSEDNSDPAHWWETIRDQMHARLIILQ